jgi:hypothetical protein
MPVPQLAPQPSAPAPSKRIIFDQGSGSPPPSTETAGDAIQIEKWHAALKAWARLALVLPLLALVLTILPSDLSAEATFGPVKIKPIGGLRELIAIVVALLIVKLTRDASRLLAFSRFTDISVEVSDKGSYLCFR